MNFWVHLTFVKHNYAFTILTMLFLLIFNKCYYFVLFTVWYIFLNVFIYIMFNKVIIINWRIHFPDWNKETEDKRRNPSMFYSSIINFVQHFHCDLLNQHVWCYNSSRCYFIYNADMPHLGACSCGTTFIRHFLKRTIPLFRPKQFIFQLISCCIYVY